ncbi:hypothetical protein DI09_47p200 [Mitosporidium daphniae]|uniref:Uncharacterized protein n=1 Tax=Mitosporidium daphniae TaxID=1485682 RepID=A0A098VPQ8_9MICR|nr:uncharacterized protein DI09_47p200 [Mitosporidium daphniae]KGG51042.1 hypothetical protein DI09_47p200 [Mitosporidium daphniae]|eukprot:XP_013237469.1 uncharacterized protein DI09_47p200 [Mitosporidium daphniae]
MKKRRIQNFDLRPGDTGIMLTCFKGREHTISGELMNIISIECEDQCGDDEQKPDVTSSFSDAFDNELKSLGSQKKGSYSLAGMGDVKCIIFAKPTNQNEPSKKQLPLELTLRIWERALNTGVKHSRYQYAG